MNSLCFISTIVCLYYISNMTALIMFIIIQEWQEDMKELLKKGEESKQQGDVPTLY